MELVGFEPILVAELSKSARDTYLENRLDLDATRVVTDVRGLSRGSRRQLRAVAKLAPGEYPTLLSGGPPCQGFSGIGHRRTNSDVEKREIASNHLYQDMVRIIGKLQPHFFLFENVRGLLSARWHRDKPGKVWDTIRKHFIRQLSGEYAIAFETVHGYQYGVPQNRHRALPDAVTKAEKEACYTEQAVADAERVLANKEKAHDAAVAKLEGLQEEKATSEAELAAIDIELKKLAELV